MILFLPFSPDEVMKEVGRILDVQRREKKPSSWVFNECIAWEDRNRFQVIPVYGRFYHVATQARRLSEDEIDPEAMKADLQARFRRYWSPPRILLRIGVGSVRLIGIGLLFTIVGLAQVGLSAWVGNVPAAAIVIGVLLGVILIPQGVNEVWKWIRRRDDEKSLVYQQDVRRRLGRARSARCPKCGKSLDGRKGEADGSVLCECGHRVERDAAS